MMDAHHWEVSVVDTEYFHDGSQQRSLRLVNLIPNRYILSVAHDLVDEHISDQMERQRQASVEAAERE